MRLMASITGGTEGLTGVRLQRGNHAAVRRILGTWVLTAMLAICWLAPAAASAQGWVGEDLRGVTCRGKNQGYGPFDWRDRHRLGKQVTIVTGAHFTEEVRHLVSGRSSLTPLGDLDYTVRAIPNHHDALFSIVRYYTEKSKWAEYADPYAYDHDNPTPPECYLNRAIAFAPDDPLVYAIYGIYLYKIEMYDEAAAKLEKALSLNNKLAEVHYNLGLVYVKQENYEGAAEHADAAEKLGYPLKGLKRILKRRTDNETSASEPTSGSAPES